MGLQRIRQDKRLSTHTLVYLKISSPVCMTVPFSVQSCLCCLAVNIFLGQVTCNLSLGWGMMTMTSFLGDTLRLTDSPNQCERKGAIMI